MLKRIFDLILSLTLFLLIMPALFFLAVLVFFFIGPRVFFVQDRPGRGCRPFKLIKFRTMSDAVDEGGELLPDNLRLSKFGRMLRCTSLDELPTLINVIKGDMSLVGPRPLLMDYLPLYTQKQNRRHDVRPGVTGWAQINGRNLLEWRDKFELDVWYVDNHTFFLDLKILMLTVKKVIGRDGINSDAETTMSRFTGND
jgi:sugar transferase EpsL